MSENIKELWKAAVEEFGDEAWQRFNSKTPLIFLYNSEVEANLELCELKTLPELFAHDVEIYGKNAYLMWQYNYLGEININQYWINLSSNDITHCDTVLRRKVSAELSFDLERAKAGDVVQLITGEPCTFLYQIVNYGNVAQNEALISVNGKEQYARFEELRMKYPVRREL